MKRLLIALSVVLVGCATTPSGNESQQPISMQGTTTDAGNRAKVHTDLGMMYLRDGQFNIAQDEARLAIEADSTYPLAHNLLALVHMFLKEIRPAESAFRRALQLAPTDPEINNNMGWFLCQSGRERESFPYFMTAARSPLYAEPTKPLTNAGICAIKSRDDKAAADFLTRALLVESSNLEANFLLADVLYRMGRYAEARGRLDELHRQAEVTAESGWLGLRIERKLGDRDAESRYATTLRRKFPNSPQYQRLIQGQYE